MIDTVFRIRRKSDGKFSKGTSHPEFTGRGRFFVNHVALKNHIRWFLKGPHRYGYDYNIIPSGPKPTPTDYEIVTYAVTEIDTTELT